MFEKIKKDLDNLETKVKRALDESIQKLPFEHSGDQNCPTFYDGCHCTVECLRYNIERAELAEEKLKNRTKYFMTSDNDGHYYIIPVEKREEWAKFLDDVYDNFLDVRLPDGVIEVDGCPSQVEFYLE